MEILSPFLEIDPKLIDLEKRLKIQIDSKK